MLGITKALGVWKSFLYGRQNIGLDGFAEDISPTEDWIGYFLQKMCSNLLSCTSGVLWRWRALIWDDFKVPLGSRIKIPPNMFSGRGQPRETQILECTASSSKNNCSSNIEPGVHLNSSDWNVLSLCWIQALKLPMQFSKVSGKWELPCNCCSGTWGFIAAQLLQ